MKPIAPDAWADEMESAQDTALPTPVFAGEGAGVYVMEGMPEGIQDAEPPPGIHARWGKRGSSKPGAMPRLVGRQLGRPTVRAPLAGGEVNGHGVFAGVASRPFSITHVGGNKWRVQGGLLEWQEIRGMGEAGGEGEETPLIYAKRFYEVPTRTFTVSPTFTTLIGFRVSWRKQSAQYFEIDFTLDSMTTSRPQPTVTAEVLVGVQVTPGHSVPDDIYTPVGSDFLPWIALTTDSSRAFWDVQEGLLPSSLIVPHIGFAWWP